MGNDNLAHELIEKKTYVRLFWEAMNYQLFEVDSHPFTLSKIVIGVLLFAAGYWFSRRASRAVERRLLTKMQMEDSLRYALGRFSFYLFLVISTLFTLHLLSVPIAVFAVVGSAVAIGVGFGSQNVIYNFISGLLVMIERPIRVGDYIEVDALAGTVQEIGIRSTVLLTPNNALVIVPNTFFLEKAVINWTLGDEFQTASIRIGVAYETPVRELERLSIQAARSIPMIVPDRPVRVLFSDFGESALVFDISFWCQAHTSGERKQVESDLRFAVQALFQAQGIVMPYPQREVHLRTGKSIEVV